MSNDARPLCATCNHRDTQHDDPTNTGGPSVCCASDCDCGEFVMALDEALALAREIFDRDVARADEMKRRRKAGTSWEVY